MTFTEFQATRKFVDNIHDYSQDDYSDATDGYVYADSKYSYGFYIEQRSGYIHHANGVDSVLSEDYELVIGNQSYVDDDLEALERILWDTFAQAECNTLGA